MIGGGELISNTIRATEHIIERDDPVIICGRDRTKESKISIIGDHSVLTMANDFTKNHNRLVTGISLILLNLYIEVEMIFKNDKDDL